MSERVIDEILETIWMLSEQNRRNQKDVLSETGESEGESLLAQMDKDGLIRLDGERVELLEPGKERAQGIIRRHRLAERLLVDILEMERGEMESHACEFEHILSSSVTDSICTLLGHPPTCPHGKPIPPGDCCQQHKKHLAPLVIPLTDLPVGEEGRIIFIHPREHGLLHRLSPLGVIPGSTVRMHQKRPSFVIEIGETTLAIDEEIAHEIYVKPSSDLSHREYGRKRWRWGTVERAEKRKTRWLNGRK